MNCITFAAVCLPLLCLIIYLKILAKVLDDIFEKQIFRYGSRGLWIAAVILFNIVGITAYLLLEQRNKHS